MVSGGPAISTTSVPIATSTPVNVSAGPVNPPPLTVGAESTIKASYPAVLKGRTTASPPIPNIVPSGKVPPPVPPRGSGRARTEELRGISASTSTSGRGEASSAFLHETAPTHHIRSPKGPLHAITPSQCLPSSASDSVCRIKAQWVDSNDPRFSFYDNVHLQQFQSQKYSQDYSQRGFEDDEFVSVEKVEDSYYLRTSPCPFRPERRNFENEIESPSMKSLQQELKNWIKEERPAQPTRLTKFTYFINPSQNPDLMNYKMSRKDKKHSETYYEMIQRKEREAREKEMDVIIRPANRGSSSHPVQSGPNHSKIFAPEHRRHSLLRHNIFEKRLNKKKLAPIPSIKKFIATASSSAFSGSNDLRTVASVRREIEIQFGQRPGFKSSDNESKFEERGRNDSVIKERVDIVKPTSISQRSDNRVTKSNDSMPLPDLSYLHGYSNTRIYKF